MSSSYRLFATTVSVMVLLCFVVLLTQSSSYIDSSVHKVPHVTFIATPMLTATTQKYVLLLSTGTCTYNSFKHLPVEHLFTTSSLSWALVLPLKHWSFLSVSTMKQFKVDLYTSPVQTDTYPVILTEQVVRVYTCIVTYIHHRACDNWPVEDAKF